MTDMTIEEELSITCEQRDALDIECARLEKEVDALRKDAERYRWLRHKMTCGQFTKDEELAVLGARDASSFDAVIDAMNGANT